VGSINRIARGRARGSSRDLARRVRVIPTMSCTEDLV
jgi:hypothetical protein